jgi:hypothetical protein
VTSLDGSVAEDLLAPRAVQPGVLWGLKAGRSSARTEKAFVMALGGARRTWAGAPRIADRVAMRLSLSQIVASSVLPKSYQAFGAP